MTAETAGFIAAQRTGHGVPRSVACRALEVPESTFCKHLNRAAGAEVGRAFGESQGAYGSPGVTARLRRGGIAVSRKTVEASMARQGLCARPKPKKRGLTGQNPAHWLLRAC